jgi:hypothetical protein
VGIPHLGESRRHRADDHPAVSVSPLSSNSAALDLLTSGLDGSTASAALTGQGGAAAADPNFEDALFSSSNGDPSLSQAAYADPGLASELSALQALADPTVTGGPLLDGTGDPMLDASSTVPGQVNQDVLAAYQRSGALTPDISGDAQAGSTGFDTFA